MHFIYSLLFYVQMCTIVYFVYNIRLSLHFELLVRQNKAFEDITMHVLGFVLGIFFLPFSDT